MQLEETIARRVVALHREMLDGEMRHILKRNIMDSFASICGSLHDREMLLNFDRLVSGVASGADLDVWGIQKRGSFADALFVNSIMARRSDLLSTYLSPNNMGGVHPSDNVALALVLADWQAMNGSQLLECVHTMFYLSAAFGTYYNPEPANYDHDAAATFIAALAIGCVLGCSEEQLVSVQRIAGMFGLDINQAAVGQMTDWKHCTYASCALRGLQAARLALAGFQAPPEIYEGNAGVNRFLPHVESFFEPPPNLGRIIFKRWPALVFCQTPIDISLDLSPKIPDAKTIESVTVKTYEVAHRNGALLGAWKPTSRAGRTHSIPYCVATALLKRVSYEDFDEPRAEDPDLVELINRIRVVNDPELTKAYPAKSRCVIELTLKDGTSIRADRDYPKGDPGDPLSDREIEEKLETYFFFAANDSEKSEIIEKLWKLEEQSNLKWLISPLKRRLI
ncbi:MAG: MmgE/PrpD family protein [Pirellulales bacterium]|nr:MmgE/PrpD family protein [Pirellulales bacterium]